jgi:glycine hydroxymethyltransferase
MAEGMFRGMIAKETDQWQIQSAGIATGGGQTPSDHTLSILSEDDIDLSGNRSQVISADLVTRASHIFAMSASHLYTLEILFPEAVEKTFLVTEFCANDSIRGHDVPDPIGGGLTAYTEVRDLLREALPGILKFVLQTPPRKN